MDGHCSSIFYSFITIKLLISILHYHLVWRSRLQPRTMTPGGPRVILQGESSGQNTTSAGMDLISVDVFGTCCLKQAQIMTEERKLTFPASFPRNCIMLLLVQTWIGAERNRDEIRREIRNQAGKLRAKEEVLHMPLTCGKKRCSKYINVC